MEQGIDRLVKTVGALESLLRPQEGIVKTKIVELFDNLSAICQQRAKNHGISFEVNVAPEVTEVPAIPGLLTQGLINLISNAQEALEESDKAGRRIELNAHLDNGWLVLEVKDNGPGIPLEVLERIQRKGSVVTTKPGKGLGIGTEIVRRVAEVHQGVFELQSKVKDGTTAMLKIPIKRQGEM